MVIYYTHSYSNIKGESRMLLGKAIEEFLKTGQSGDEVMEDLTASASDFVRSVRTAGEFGKPYIPGFAPFSISHSLGTWAVLIDDSAYVSADAAYISPVTCGLDIQYPRKVDAAAVTERFFAKEDADLILSCQDRARAAEGESAVTDDAFFRLWTRREALVKAAGTSVAGSDVPSVCEDTVTYNKEDFLLRDITIPGGRMYAAICVQAGGAHSDGCISLTMKELRY